jgi:hypothetical protein
MGISPLKAMKLSGVKDMDDCLYKVQFLSSKISLFKQRELAKK